MSARNFPKSSLSLKNSLKGRTVIPVTESTLKRLAYKKVAMKGNFFVLHRSAVIILSLLILSAAFLIFLAGSTGTGIIGIDLGLVYNGL